jgi:hypothetical protein
MARWPIAVTKRHHFQRRFRQRSNVAALVTSDREHRIGKPKSGPLDILRIVAEISCDLRPCLVKGPTN